MLASVLAYGVLAHVCCSVGPVAERRARRVGGRAFAPVGPTLLRYGFAFSVGLTLFPLAIAVLFTMARVARWLGRAAAA